MTKGEYARYQKYLKLKEELDSLITEAFECDHISVTFPNDNMVRIELTNYSEGEQKDGDVE